MGHWGLVVRPKVHMYGLYEPRASLVAKLFRRAWRLPRGDDLDGLGSRAGRGRPWLGQARRVHGRDDSPAMTAVTFDNGERPRSQEADPTSSASRHSGGTATGSPQTERETEPASSAVAANARVRRRPGTRRAATAPMITTPAPTSVRCGRAVQ